MIEEGPGTCIRAEIIIYFVDTFSYVKLGLVLSNFKLQISKTTVHEVDYST